MVIHPYIDTTWNSKDLYKMKACKRGLERACSHGQYVLDKHDHDILPHSIGWHLYQPTLCKLSDLGWDWLQVSRCTFNWFQYRGFSSNLQGTIRNHFLVCWFLASSLSEFLLLFLLLCVKSCRFSLLDIFLVGIVTFQVTDVDNKAMCIHGSN